MLKNVSGIELTVAKSDMLLVSEISSMAGQTVSTATRLANQYIDVRIDTDREAQIYLLLNESALIRQVAVWLKPCYSYYLRLSSYRSSKGLACWQSSTYSS